MFTGIIEEIGTVKYKNPFGNGLRISISARKILEDIQIGDSININGVCQTVVAFDKDSFMVETVEETLKKTTLGLLKTGANVNLERALKASSRLGGHFVLGHTDPRGKIEKTTGLTASHEITISFPEEFKMLIVPVGSIAIDGISLTVADINDSSFTVAIIPHTLGATNLSNYSPGDFVNLEFDILGKYIVQLRSGKKNSKITEEWLKELGY